MSTSSAGRPGRYERSAGGLLVALLVTVLAIGGVLWFLGLFRPDVELARGEVDYLAIVGEAQDAGLEPIYPASLPEGWTAETYEAQGGAFDLRLFTEDGEFVGVHQESAATSELVREHVGEEVSAIDIYTADSSVAEAWEGFEDEDGDAAYAAEVAGQTVLVYGPASPGELQEIVELLTVAPVDAG